MTDPIWRKVSELTHGHPPEFNVAPVYALVREAWRMGFNVVLDPNAASLYSEFIRAQNEALGNCPENGIAGMMNARNLKAAR